MSQIVNKAEISLGFLVSRGSGKEKGEGREEERRMRGRGRRSTYSYLRLLAAIVLSYLVQNLQQFYFPE